MCGIVGAIATREVSPILVEGLRRLEYRGYDSAGLAVLSEDHELHRARALGKVQGLADKLVNQPALGHLGIAHTRWATHGEPSEANAHPHVCGQSLAVVHNGIIENYIELRDELQAAGHEFVSQTDTEVVAHLLADCRKTESDLLQALRQAATRLRGAWALAVIATDVADEIIIARSGSPLVIGVGEGENFVASDVAALLPETNRFVFLEEGDIGRVRRDGYELFNADGEPVVREVRQSELKADAADKGEYAHYMLKETYEQPSAIAATLEGRLADDHILDGVFATHPGLLEEIRGVHIIACGTSYHAGLVARYWIEQLARIPCVVEIASEYRYRQPVVQAGRLFVTISQSGETADTLAALELSKQLGYLASLAICNVPESSLVRESDLAMMTRAGQEIGVASTKAFTTQLVALLIMAATLGRRNGPEGERETVRQLKVLGPTLEATLGMDVAIQKLAKRFADKQHSLFLGRGINYPVAMEGALKLKEISYIHAEAYAAGELKHGPLALVDAEMPVIAVAPNNQLLEKLKSNLEEVRARGGELIVFADANSGIQESDGVTVLLVPHAESLIEPIVYTLPLQLLSYHVAVIKGTDVDQPRNLAKSVTVE